MDFALAFAMVHEVPNPEGLFADIAKALKRGGKLLFAEPSGHVSAQAFALSLSQAEHAGLVVEAQACIRRSHAALLRRV